MTEETVLKPCPICGSVNIWDNYDAIPPEARKTHVFPGYIWHNIECRDCALILKGRYESFDDAASAWNRRTPEPGTSAVRWVRYDGTEETLPKIYGDSSFAVIASLTNGQDIVCTLEPVKESFRERFFPLGVKWQSVKTILYAISPKIGDLWAYLPEPPEGMG